MPAPTLAPGCVCSLNSTLNLLNKWALGVHGFRFPMLLTSCALGTACCAAASAQHAAQSCVAGAQPAAQRCGCAYSQLRSNPAHGRGPACSSLSSTYATLHALPSRSRPHGRHLPGAGPHCAARALGVAPPHGGAPVGGPVRHRSLHVAQHSSEQRVPGGHIPVTEPNHQVRGGGGGGHCGWVGGGVGTK